jgi:hypothetical protein
MTKKSVVRLWKKTLKGKACTLHWNNQDVSEEKIIEMARDQQMICYYCGDGMLIHSHGGLRKYTMSVDHVVPGGDKVVLACYNCNNLKRNMDPAQLRNFADKIEEALV